jgi:5-methylcytosine-specific restriction endonuclease McrA
VSKYDAIGKLYTEVVEAIVIEKDGQYSTYDFDLWIERSAGDDWPDGYEFINAIKFRVAIPKVVRCLRYDKVPRVSVRLSKRAVFSRDDCTCYLCGKKFKEKDLTVDHVIPISRGGPNAWENLASCCKKCNGKKEDKLLNELGLKPKFLPYRPRGGDNASALRAMVLEAPVEWSAFGV